MVNTVSLMMMMISCLKLHF